MNFTKEEISIIIQTLDSFIEQNKKANQMLSLMEKLNGK